MKPPEKNPLKISLKVKALLFMTAMILAVGIVLSWAFLSRSEEMLTGELQKRALAFTNNLAHSAKYGILTEDVEILKEVADGTLQEDSILYVRISTAQGKVLVERFKQPETRPVISLAHQHVAELDRGVVNEASLHHHVIGGEGIYHTVTPVITSRPTSTREKRLSTALLLLSTESNTEPSGDPDIVRHGSVQLLVSSEKVLAEIRNTFISGAGLTLIIVVIAVAISFVGVGYVLSPIRAMADAALKISGGDLSQRVAVNTRDEIGVLATTFNDMSESLSRMTQAQQQRLSELSALYDISLAMSSTLDLDRLIDLTLHAVTEKLGYDRAMFFQKDTERQALVNGRTAGFPKNIQRRIRGLELPLQDGEDGLCTTVALKGEAILVENVDETKKRIDSPLVDVLNAQSLLVVPVKFEDQMLGVMVVGYAGTNQNLTSADMKLMTTLSNELGMAIANVSAYREIERLNISLEGKVQKRTAQLQHQQERLEHVNEELRKATRHKSEFLARMSHELRTPMNAIIGFSEVLLEKMFGELNDKQEEYLNDISTSGKHLLNLINDILDLSKIEAGKLELELGTFDLRKLLEGSLVVVKESAFAHGITLSLDVPDDIDTVIADERKVKQITFNLLSNAVKFTPDKGEVGIKARKTEGVVEIAVWDTGIGIAAEDQPRVFEEFQQVGETLTGEPEGTGLGLALAKKFVELHGGKIWVGSTPGRGSTFTFTVPVKAGVLDTPAPAEQEETAEEPAVEARSGGPLVLVIEDDPKAADLLRIYLSETGYDVEIAEDGAEGLEKIKRLSPGAVILDVLLPKVDGWDLLSQVKADPATKDIPVIIVSIVDQKGKGFALGAADYLVKPIKKEALLRAVEAFKLVKRTAPIKVLAIDDDANTVELIAAALEPEGFQVLKTYGGEEGIAVAKTEQPDVIILDLLMPGVNGFEVLDRLERLPVRTKPPIIIFTIKHLSAKEKERLKGRIARLAQKEAYNPARLVGMVKEVVRHA